MGSKSLFCFRKSEICILNTVSTEVTLAPSNLAFSGSILHILFSSSRHCLTFTCGHQKRLTNGNVWTRINLKTDKYLSVFKFIRIRVDGAWGEGERGISGMQWFSGETEGGSPTECKGSLKRIDWQIDGGGEGSKEYCKPLGWGKFTLTQPKSFAHYLTKMLHCVVMSSVLILSFFVIDCIRSVTQDCLLPLIQIIRFTE